MNISRARDDVKHLSPWANRTDVSVQTFPTHLAPLFTTAFTSAV